MKFFSIRYFFGKNVSLAVCTAGYFTFLKTWTNNSYLMFSTLISSPELEPREQIIRKNTSWNIFDFLLKTNQKVYCHCLWSVLTSQTALRSSWRLTRLDHRVNMAVRILHFLVKIKSTLTTIIISTIDDSPNKWGLYNH